MASAALTRIIDYLRYSFSGRSLDAASNFGYVAVNGFARLRDECNAACVVTILIGLAASYFATALSPAPSRAVWIAVQALASGRLPSMSTILALGK